MFEIFFCFSGVAPPFSRISFFSCYLSGRYHSLCPFPIFRGQMPPFITLPFTCLWNNTSQTNLSVTACKPAGLLLCRTGLIFFLHPLQDVRGLRFFSRRKTTAVQTIQKLVGFKPILSYFSKFILP